MRDLRRPHGDLLLYYDPSWIYAGSHHLATLCIPHGAGSSVKNTDPSA